MHRWSGIFGYLAGLDVPIQCPLGVKPSTVSTARQLERDVDECSQSIGDAQRRRAIRS